MIFDDVQAQVILLYLTMLVFSLIAEMWRRGKTDFLVGFVACAVILLDLTLIFKYVIG